MRAEGIAIARDTVHQLLAHLEDCFLVRAVSMESRSERQRMVNPRKAYPIDAALIPVFDRTGRSNVGHALETSVLIELERRRCEVAYIRTPQNHEADFRGRGGRRGPLRCRRGLGRRGGRSRRLVNMRDNAIYFD